MKEFVNESCTLSIFIWIVDPSTKSSKYELTGIVNHSGNLYGGHYTAYSWLFKLVMEKTLLMGNGIDTMIPMSGRSILICRDMIQRVVQVHIYYFILK